MPGDDVGDELGLSDATLLSEVGDGGGSGGGEAPGALDGDFTAGRCLACKDWRGWGYEALEDDIGKYGVGGGLEELSPFDYAAFEVAGCVVTDDAGFEVGVGAEFDEFAVIIEEGCRGWCSCCFLLIVFGGDVEEGSDTLADTRWLIKCVVVLVVVGISSPGFAGGGVELEVSVRPCVDDWAGACGGGAEANGGRKVGY